MVFPIEIGLVDGEGIDEVLDLALDVAAQPRKVARERAGPGGGHALDDAAFDVIPLGFGEDHAGTSVEKLAQSAKLLLGKRRELRHVAAMTASGSDQRLF